jgi:glycosyltransferase involved in cell wall biosynthesis
MKVCEANEIDGCAETAGGSPSASPAASIHVVHGVLSLDLGGLERLVLDLIKTGSDKGYRNSVVCIDRPGLLAQAAAALGAEVHCLGNESERSMATDRAAELFGRIKPDVLHTHQIGALWHLGRAARARGIRIVHTEHSDHVGLARGWRNKLRSRWWWYAAGRLAQRFCCVSEDIARSVRRWGTVGSRKVVVIANGVDTDLYGASKQRAGIRHALGIPEDARVIGTVGRLNEVKRQDLLIRAFARVRRLHANAWLLLVGDGPERSRLERLASELGVFNRTLFTGYQARTEHFLSAMDVFALSSRHEGLPLALLEAWAAGLPIVSSAVGGIPQVVEEGRTGLLFENGDEAALAGALARLLDQPQLAARLGAAGKAKVLSQYSLQHMADGYGHQYHLALSSV